MYFFIILFFNDYYYIVDINNSESKKNFILTYIRTRGRSLIIDKLNVL